MKLGDWLAENELTHVEFAGTLGRSPETVRRYVAGVRIPDKSTMPLIVQHTAGAVTANDFFGIGEIALCGACDRRAEDPEVRTCVSVNCPMREKEAA